LEPVSGGCRFFWEESFEPPLGQLGELAVEYVIGPHLRRVWTRSMENVKRLAESSLSPA
jgi:hypothetical protein